MTAFNSYPEVFTTEPVRIFSIGQVAPLDQGYPVQWGLKNIRADQAWIIARAAGSSPPAVAVIDSGIDYSHPDLWLSYLGGVNYLAPSRTSPEFYDPKDDYGHGTHVAGIIDAGTDNVIGVSGLMWDNTKSLFIIRACNENGCPYDTVVSGIKLAANSGAKIINMSLYGYKVVWEAQDPFALSYLSHTVKYAKSKGALIVAIAGNDNTDAGAYPAACLGVFAVGATDRNDQRWIGDPILDPAHGSNYGNWVNIAAPGANIFSLMPTYDVGLNKEGKNHFFDYLSGTSMAAPFVSGAAALVWTLHPTWDNDRVRKQLETTAKPLPGLQLGAGRLDLFDAIFNGSFEVKDYKPAQIINGGIVSPNTYGYSNVLCKPNTWGFFGYEVTPVTCPAPFTLYPGGYVNVLDQLGPIAPLSDKGKMWYMVTDGKLPYHARTELEQDFVIQPGVTSLSISFDYNYVTEDCALIDNSPGFQCPNLASFTILIELPGFAWGTTYDRETIAYNQRLPEYGLLNLQPVDGICISTPCKPVRMTGWQCVTIDGSILPELSNVTPGLAKIHLFVESFTEYPMVCSAACCTNDFGGNPYKSAVLINNVQLR